MGNIQRARREYAFENKGVKYQETLSALECTFQAGEMNSNFVYNNNDNDDIKLMPQVMPQ